MKLHGKKLKMDQLWLDDRVSTVTPVRIIDASAEFGEINVGDRIHVAGITKGHGFQGVVKRHGFSGGPKSHGQKNRYRAPGSIGSTAPQRVVPGRKMAGHMGVERVTIKNLKVLKIDPELKMIFFKGAVPGNRDGKVEIYK